MNDQRQCGGCRYFSPLHQCCSEQIIYQDGVLAFGQRKSTSLSCQGFYEQEPSIFKLPQKELIVMENDVRDWHGLPVVQVICESEGLQIVGTVDGLCDLANTITKAIGIGASSCDLISPDTSVYPATIHRRDLASEWDVNQPIIDRDLNVEELTDLDDLDLDYRDTF